jgi:serine O-acetyltransferase
MHNKLSTIIEKIRGSYSTDRGINHLEGPNLPSREAIEEIVLDIINVLFPGYHEKQEISRQDVNLYVWEKIVTIYHSLSHEIAKSLKAVAPAGDRNDAGQTREAVNRTLDFLGRIPAIREKLNSDVQAAYEGDPAARSFDEIILSYPGLFAIAIYRTAHEL